MQSCAEREGAVELVRFTPAAGALVELRAVCVEAENREYAPGVCVWRGQRWEPTMTNPPSKVLVSGAVVLDGQRVELDVSGLATPWISPQEMTSADCRLRKREPAEGQVYYILDVCFFKGGALDYVVTWEIRGERSQRVKIEFMGDTYPEWYCSGALAPWGSVDE